MPAARETALTPPRPGGYGFRRGQAPPSPRIQHGIERLECKRIADSSIMRRFHKPHRAVGPDRRPARRIPPQGMRELFRSRRIRAGLKRIRSNQNLFGNDGYLTICHLSDNGDLHPEPWMPRIQKLSENSPVGVLKCCCTIVSGYIPPSGISRPNRQSAKPLDPVSTKSGEGHAIGSELTVLDKERPFRVQIIDPLNKKADLLL